MLAVRIIPCLDVKDGRVVKGINFEGLRDAGDPLESAARYDSEGADEITFLDISATLEGRKTLFDLVERTADTLTIPFTVGGGIRSETDARELLLRGADRVSTNSAAVERPQLIDEIAARFGNQALVVAIDVRTIDGKPTVFTHGGKRATPLDAVAWAHECADRGAGELLVTSMDRDGTKSGYDLELLRRITSTVSVPVIASGGVGQLRDFRDGVLLGGAQALLAASVFHDRLLSIAQVKTDLAQHAIPVRPVASTLPLR